MLQQLFYGDGFSYTLIVALKKIFRIRQQRNITQYLTLYQTNTISKSNKHFAGIIVALCLSPKECCM